MNFSVNFAKIKRQAHSLGRHDSSSSSRYNPFRHVAYNNSRRANTFHDAETGRGGFAGEDPSDGGAVMHSQTAPADISPQTPTSRQNPFQASAANTSDVPDSQATVTDSPSLNGARMSEKESDDSSVVRRKIKGKPPGTENEDARYAGADEPEKSKKKQHSGFLKNIKPKEPFTIRNQIQRTFFNSWINILLLAAPPGIAISYLGVDGRIVFAVNFVAIVPLAAMLSFATEEIALRTGETVGGLINATFGNAVELIVAIIALTQNQIRVVQTSLIGSILSNLLLVLGMCFLLGGINRREQFFNTTVAQTAASLLALAVGSLIIPTIFALTPGIQQNSGASVPPLSHGVSVILLVVYICYLFFQLKTHSAVFNEESQKVPSKPLFKKRSQEMDTSVASGVARAGAGQAGVREENGSLSAMMMNPNTHNESQEDDDDEEEEPQLSTAVAFATLTISTVIIAFCAEGMVGGIEAITETGVSEEFVGLILIPIVGNACEHATAVTVAIKDKMDLAIGVAIGSSMQVALFLIPLLVIIGWGIGNPDMNLSFDEFQVAVLFIAVLLVNYLIGDGKSHWLEGMLLICLYFIIAVCSWWYPPDSDPHTPGIQIAGQ